MEKLRPKFRRARELVRQQRAAVLGRVLLAQVVRILFVRVWTVSDADLFSPAWLALPVVTALAETALLTTAFTLIYLDLAGDGAASERVAVVAEPGIPDPTLRPSF